jgi:glycosyltransferase involved in cell wall biosynthesis
MRIVQAVGWYFPDSLGGTEVYVAALCRRLLAAGQEAIVAAPDTAYRHERTYEHEGVSVYRYPVPVAPTRAECQGTVAVRGAELFHVWLAREQPDVVHFHTFVTGLGLFEIRAAKAVGARVIVTTHSSSLGWICARGSMMRWGEGLCDGICEPGKCAACALHQRGLPKVLARSLGAIPPGWGRMARAIPGKVGTALSMSDVILRNQRMQREMLQSIDMFVVLTAWGRETVLANGAPPGRVAVNRLGISLSKARRKPGPNEQPTHIPIKVGYLGRFDAIKGVHDLVRAVASLPADVSLRVELRGPVVSASERECVRELRALASDDRRLTLAPFVPHQEVPEILAGYDVLCCPAVCAEGGPTVALEAQAVGTPVIGTRIGGMIELISDETNGRLVSPGDWRALAVVLRDLAREPATVDRWRLALPSVRTMDEVTADYLTLYKA